MPICELVSLLTAIAVPQVSALTQAPPDLSTPKATVTSIIAAFSRQDNAGMAKCVERGVVYRAVEALSDSSVSMMWSDPRVNDILVSGDGETARAAVSWSVSIKIPAQNLILFQSYVDVLDLKHGAAGWHVVAPAVVSSLSDLLQSLSTRPLLLITALLGPDSSLRDEETSHQNAMLEQKCLERGKAIAAALEMFSSDHEDRLPISATEFAKKSPQYFVDEDTSLRCPGDSSSQISYSLNADLYNKRYSLIANRTKTVLIYEGSSGVLQFRHSGRAMVAFVDGVSKLVSKEEARSLIWKPTFATLRRSSTKKRKN